MKAPLGLVLGLLLATVPLPAASADDVPIPPFGWCASNFVFLHPRLPHVYAGWCLPTTDPAGEPPSVTPFPGGQPCIAAKAQNGNAAVCLLGAPPMPPVPPLPPVPGEPPVPPLPPLPESPVPLPPFGWCASTWLFVAPGLPHAFVAYCVPTLDSDGEPESVTIMPDGRPCVVAKVQNGLVAVCLFGLPSAPGAPPLPAPPGAPPVPPSPIPVPPFGWCAATFVGILPGLPYAYASYCVPTLDPAGEPPAVNVFPNGQPCVGIRAQNGQATICLLNAPVAPPSPACVQAEDKLACLLEGV